ncbi:MAG: hypothetical protein GY842_18325, partial [bacterium]|nr:hypothetical protein [bacterium]
ARFYDPKHARWLQRDPTGYTDGNALYEAFANNATANTDPMGTEVWIQAERYRTTYSGMPLWAVVYRLNRNGLDRGWRGLLNPSEVESHVLGIDYFPYTESLRRLRAVDANIESMRGALELQAIAGEDIAAYRSSIKLAAAAPVIIASAGMAGQGFAVARTAASSGGLLSTEGLFVLGVNAPQIAVGAGTGVAGSSVAVGLSGYAISDVHPELGPKLEAGGEIGLFSGVILFGLGAEAGGAQAHASSRAPARPTASGTSAVINSRLTQRLAAWRAYQARGGMLEMRPWVQATQRQYGGMSGGYPSGYGAWIRSVESTHGGAALSLNRAHLYGLYGESGEFLKWGVTGDPQSRYPRNYMVLKRLRVFETGSRRLMLQLERERVEVNPGPLNLEPWAGVYAP